MEDPGRCPRRHCGSERIVKDGHNHGYQWYRCRSCNKQFRAEDGWHGRHFPPEIIARAPELFYAGTTYQRIPAVLVEEFGEVCSSISSRTVYQWVRFCTEAAYRLMTEHRPATGCCWVIDQVWSPAVASGVWVVSDAGIGYVLAGRFCRDSGYQHVTPLVRRALEATANRDVQAWTFRTTLFREASRSFNRRVQTSVSRCLPEATQVGIEEMAIPSTQTRPRAFGDFDPWVWDRFRRLRSDESARCFLNGLTVVHNVFQDTGARDGQAPCRLAGGRAPFASWLDVVRMGGRGSRGHGLKAQEG